MSAQVETLRDLYVELAGDTPVTERQVDVGSREPIEMEEDPSEEVSKYVREDGLTEALEGVEGET